MSETELKLEAVVTKLVPLLPHVSKNTGDATLRLLLLVLSEAVDREEAIAKRARGLSSMSPKELVVYFSSFGEKTQSEVTLDSGGCGSDLATATEDDSREEEQPNKRIKM